MAQRASKSVLVYRTLPSPLLSVCHFLGDFAACVGWAIFAVGMLLATMQDAKVLTNLFFVSAGYFLVSGWFLLRFADGLFPFSKKLFKTIMVEESLS
jgi:hypothetical protein